MGIFVLLGFAALVIIIAGTFALIHGLLHPPRRTLAWALAHQLPADPGELDLPFTEKIFRFPDGTQTTAWLIEGQNASGPIIVGSHGFGDSRYGLLPWIDAFLPYARAIVLYDLRGHGESTAPISRLATTEPDDLLHLVHELSVEFPQAKFVLYGASMGAGIAIVAAAKSTSGSSNSPVVGVIAEGPYCDPKEPVLGFLRTRQFPTFPFGHLAFWHIYFWLGNFQGFNRALHARHVNCPMLVLGGALDPICKYESAQEIARVAPDAELVTFEQGGHLDLAAVDEPRYLDALARFFSKVSEKNHNPQTPASPAPTSSKAQPESPHEQPEQFNRQPH